MERRDVLKLLGSATVLSAFPAEAMDMIHQMSMQAAKSAGVRTLSPHQNATVTLMTEIILPATDTPGAKDAKVNEFIDLLLTEWYEPSERAQFLAGLADVDAQSKKAFSKAFVDGTPEQQKKLMTYLDDSAFEHRSKNRIATDTHAASLPADFFLQFKRLTLVGFYTSEVGITKELGKPGISVGYTGCAPVKETR